jgi:hypothetical protein
MPANLRRGKPRLPKLVATQTASIGCRPAVRALGPSTGDDPAGAAATWVTRRFGVRPLLALTVAAHAGLGGRHHG